MPRGSFHLSQCNSNLLAFFTHSRTKYLHIHSLSLFVHSRLRSLIIVLILSSCSIHTAIEWRRRRRPRIDFISNNTTVFNLREVKVHQRSFSFEHCSSWTFWWGEGYKARLRTDLHRAIAGENLSFSAERNRALRLRLNKYWPERMRELLAEIIAWIRRTRTSDMSFSTLFMLTWRDTSKYFFCHTCFSRRRSGFLIHLPILWQISHSVYAEGRTSCLHITKVLLDRIKRLRKRR